MSAAAWTGRPPARVAVRAGLLVGAFVVALVVWPPRGAAAARPPLTADPGAALATSLSALALALALGGGVVPVLAWGLTGRVEAGRPRAGALLELVGRLVKLPWLAVSPVALTAAWVIPFGSGPGSVTALEVIAIGGMAAGFVAGAAYEPLRRDDRTGAALAAVGGIGRGLLAGTGALVLIETVANRPGLGRLLVESALARTAGASLVTPLLVIGLVGSLLSLAGDDARAPVRPQLPAQRWWDLATIVGLGIPVLLLPVSFAFAAGGPGPLAQLMIGFRTSLGLALGAALLAVVVGGAWGTLAMSVAAGGPSGGALADAIVAPAWVVAVLPLLPAVILLRQGMPSLAIAVAIGVALLPKVALVVRDLEPPDLTPAALLPAAAGIFVRCVGVAFVAGTSVDAIGIGTAPPSVSLGTVLADAITRLFAGGAGTVALVALLSLLTAGPCIFAAWTLVRPINRGQALARLFT